VRTLDDGDSLAVADRLQQKPNVHGVRPRDSQGGSQRRAVVVQARYGIDRCIAAGLDRYVCCDLIDDQATNAEMLRQQPENETEIDEWSNSCFELHKNIILELR
jgi:hypothetical protein